MNVNILVIYFFTYFLIYLHTYLLIYLLTYLLTYLFSYSLTHSLHEGESLEKLNGSRQVLLEPLVLMSSEKSVFVCDWEPSYLFIGFISK
jgi:hypothetical protein